MATETWTLVESRFSRRWRRDDGVERAQLMASAYFVGTEARTCLGQVICYLYRVEEISTGEPPLQLTTKAWVRPGSSPLLAFLASDPSHELGSSIVVTW